MTYLIESLYVITSLVVLFGLLRMYTPVGVGWILGYKEYVKLNEVNGKYRVVGTGIDRTLESLDDALHLKASIEIELLHKL